VCKCVCAYVSVECMCVFVCEHVCVCVCVCVCMCVCMCVIIVRHKWAHSFSSKAGKSRSNLSKHPVIVCGPHCTHLQAGAAWHQSAVADLWKRWVEFRVGQNRTVYRILNRDISPQIYRQIYKYMVYALLVCVGCVYMCVCLCAYVRVWLCVYV